MRASFLLLCVGLALPVSAVAEQVYRCTNAEGSVEYRDVPCAGQSGGRISIEPNVTREIDQSAARAASKLIADRMAVRAQAEEQAARARTVRDGDAARMQGGEIPWWQQSGTPPDRDKSPQEAPPSTQPSTAKPPPIAPAVRPVPRNAVLVQPASIR
jgi:hypothetical protein